MDGAPEGASLDPVTGAFRWTPPGNASGSYAVTFTASDGHSSSSETVTIAVADANHAPPQSRSEEHTSELQSLMRISYAVFCLKKKNQYTKTNRESRHQHNITTKTVTIVV